MKQFFTMVVLAAALMGAGAASAETPTIARIKTITTELGYKPSASADVVLIEDLGNQKADIRFIVAADKSTFQIYASQAVPAEKVDAIPALAMLKANSSSPFAFGVYVKDDQTIFDLEATYDASLFSKPLIKKLIAQLVETIDANEELWSIDKWPAPTLAKADPRIPSAIAQAAAAAVNGGSQAPARSYAALQDEADKAWLATPISVGRALLLTEKAKDFGVYTIRPNAVFKRGDSANLYFEAANFDWGQPKDGVYSFGVSADLSVKSKSRDSAGQAVDISMPDLAKLPISNRNKLKNLFFTVDLALKDTLPLGAYTIGVTLHDLNTGKTANAEIPITLTE